MWIFKRTPPPPPPIYRRQPIATAALAVTLFATLIIGPTQYIARGMDAKIEKNAENIEDIQRVKATNENVKAALDELKEQRKEQADANKEQNTSIQTNQQAIQEILIRQEISAPKNITIKAKTVTEENRVVGKKAVPPDFFVKFHEMAPALQEKYLRYLRHKGYDTEGLE